MVYQVVIHAIKKDKNKEGRWDMSEDGRFTNNY